MNKKVKVEIYTAHPCGYCRRAKALLQSKNVDFSEIDITHDEKKRAWLEKMSGRRSVPQIFINDQPIGGYFELQELENQKKLESLLNPTS